MKYKQCVCACVCFTVNMRSILGISCLTNYTRQSLIICAFLKFRNCTRFLRQSSTSIISDWKWCHLRSAIEHVHRANSDVTHIIKNFIDLSLEIARIASYIEIFWRIYAVGMWAGAAILNATPCGGFSNFDKSLETIGSGWPTFFPVSEMIFYCLHEHPQTTVLCIDRITKSQNSSSCQKADVSETAFQIRKQKIDECLWKPVWISVPFCASMAVSDVISSSNRINKRCLLVNDEHVGGDRVLSP